MVTFPIIGILGDDFFTTWLDDRDADPSELLNFLVCDIIISSFCCSHS